MKTFHLPGKSCSWFVLALFAFIASLASATELHFHEFVVQARPVTRLCKTQSIITVNGQFPGPTVEARNGDFVIIKVVNAAQYNISIHWYIASSFSFIFTWNSCLNIILFGQNFSPH
ncbi:hypothetical protein V8G54_033170 [Vigna mungo]|uniref:Plastocyanin-like domain-containing protein n=1 Tax=Vigna mungo TaxID=3915 RepID=A0AAQ3MMW6_VIGMU